MLFIGLALYIGLIVAIVVGAPRRQEIVNGRRCYKARR